MLHAISLPTSASAYDVLLSLPPPLVCNKAPDTVDNNYHLPRESGNVLWTFSVRLEEQQMARVQHWMDVHYTRTWEFNNENALLPPIKLVAIFRGRTAHSVSTNLHGL